MFCPNFIEEEGLDDITTLGKHEVGALHLAKEIRSRSHKAFSSIYISSISVGPGVA